MIPFEVGKKNSSFKISLLILPVLFLCLGDSTTLFASDALLALICDEQMRTGTWTSSQESPLTSQLSHENLAIEKIHSAEEAYQLLKDYDFFRSGEFRDAVLNVVSKEKTEGLSSLPAEIEEFENGTPEAKTNAGIQILKEASRLLIEGIEREKTLLPYDYDKMKEPQRSFVQSISLVLATTLQTPEKLNYFADALYQEVLFHARLAYLDAQGEKFNSAAKTAKTSLEKLWGARTWWDDLFSGPFEKSKAALEKDKRDAEAALSAVTEQRKKFLGKRYGELIISYLSFQGGSRRIREDFGPATFQHLTHFEIMRYQYDTVAKIEETLRKLNVFIYNIQLNQNWTSILQPASRLKDRFSVAEKIDLVGKLTHFAHEVRRHQHEYSKIKSELNEAMKTLNIAILAGRQLLGGVDLQMHDKSRFEKQVAQYELRLQVLSQNQRLFIARDRALLPAEEVLSTAETILEHILSNLPTSDLSSVTWQKFAQEIETVALQMTHEESK